MLLRSIAVNIVRQLQSAGFEAFWVGGCVRDVLLGREPGDYDVATSAKPAEIERLFRRTVAVGKQFGVVLIVEEGHEFEVATFRTEGGYEDGRHPGRVSFATAREDASRRDFTINGLFYDPLLGQTFDWVGGRADLEARLVRTIGNPDARFAEDHLRLLRAVRFAAQLGFQIEGETLAAIQRNGPQIIRISAERIRDELVKLFRPPYAGRGLELLYESTLLAHVLPELDATVHCEQSPQYHPEGSVFKHLVRMLELLPAGAPASLPWAVLLHDIAKPITATKDPASGTIRFYEHEKLGATIAEELLRRLKFPRKEIEEIVQSVRCHMQFKDVPQMRKATVRRMILRSTFPLELELHRLDCLGSHGSLEIYQTLVEQVREFDQQPALKPPLVNGRDLIEAGMKPGPDLGALLAEIRDKQLQDELKTHAEALAWARLRLGQNMPE